MDKSELVKRVGHYFEDEKVSVMYATPDGNFFHKDSLNYAQSHARTKKVEVITITRADMKSKEEKKLPPAVEIPEAKAEESADKSVEEHKIEEEKKPRKRKKK